MPHREARARRIGAPWWGKVSQSCDRAVCCARVLRKRGSTWRRATTPSHRGTRPDTRTAQARRRSAVLTYTRVLARRRPPLVRSLMDERPPARAARMHHSSPSAVETRTCSSRPGGHYLRRGTKCGLARVPPSEDRNGKRSLLGRCVANGRSSDDGCDDDLHVQMALSRCRANRFAKDGSRGCSPSPTGRTTASAWSQHAALTSGRKSEARSRNELDRGCSETAPGDRTIVKARSGD